MLVCHAMHGQSEPSVDPMPRHRLRRSGACAFALMLALVGTVATAAESGKKAQEPSQAELEQQLEAARKRLDAAAREVAELSMALSENIVPPVPPFFGMSRQRALLGINLGSSRGASADGVAIVSVSPGGAAAEAGLKAGDVLLELNGATLQGDDDSPREKLMDVMRDVKPGDKVPVSYRREGKVLKATLTAQPIADRMFTMPLPPLEPGMIARGFMRAEGVFGSAELVALTPKLGQYFGTETGLLVVRAPDDSRLKLEDGDVIVDIDGRKPANPSHALRILSSYQAGEKLELNVLRARKRMTFEITIPDESSERSFERAHLIEDTLMYAPAQPLIGPAPPGMPAVEAISIVAPLPEEPL